MSSKATDEYLATQVTTATPQKLQLLLIEGATRFTTQAKQLIEQGNLEAGADALVRAREIVAELLASAAGGESEIGRRLSGVYLFLFRSLSEAHNEADLDKLDEVLRVLEIERETWRMVCERFGATSNSGDQSNTIPGADAGSLPQSLPTLDVQPSDTTTGGFSLEA